MRIAFSGKQGSGKTTLSNFLVLTHGYERVSFAQSLKEMAMSDYGLSYHEAFGVNKNRVFLQRLGLEKRQEDPDYWVKLVANKVSSNPNKNYVLDDLRFPNEANYLKSNGFLLVRLECSEDVRKNRIPNTFGNPHDESETSLDSYLGWDYVIRSDRETIDVMKDLDSFINKYSSLDNV